MKRIIIFPVVALMAITAAQASHRQPVKVERDSTDVARKEVNISDSALVVKKGDKVITISYGKLKDFIEDHLDDTLFTGAEPAVTIAGDDDGEADEETTTDRAGNDYYYYEHATNVEGMQLSRDISSYFATAAVFIVFFALLFYYLHRARKYKTVDRAIAAGYPLPDEFYLGRKAVNNNIYTQPGPDGVPPLPSYAPSGRLLDNITDWNLFKPGLTLSAVGLGMCLFFLVAGAKPLAALMVILLIIGLGRLFVAYQEQLNINRFRAASAQQKQQQPAQPAPAQPTATQQPPMPPQDFPPEFNDPNSTSQQ